jgi:hypothetical protein
MEFRTLYLEFVDSSGMIRSLLAGISQEEARAKPAADSWSILETLCHLYDEECLDFRPRLDIILHRNHEAWTPIDPTGWVSQRNYNEQVFRDVKEKFFGERSRSLDWLKGLEQANWETSYLSSFGEITAGDMFASWVAHDNLALRQLVELRRARLERITQPFSISYAGDW